MEKSTTIIDYLYNKMSDVELETLVTSVSVKTLKKAKTDKLTLSALIAGIDGENADIEAANLKKLSDCFALAFKCAPFMAREKYWFLRKFSKVREATKNFSVTFQEGPDENTIGNTESGFTPYCKTRITAAGLRACFNSYHIFRDEVSRNARKQVKEKELQKASANLAASLGIDAALLTPEVLAKFGFTRVCKVD